MNRLNSANQISANQIWNRLNLSIDGLVIALFSLFYGYGALGLEKQTAFGDHLGASFFPLLISGILFLVGIFMILQQAGVDHAAVWPKKNFWKQISFFLSFLFLYAIVLDKIGFILATSLMIFYTATTLKSKWYWSLLLGLVVSLSVYLLFDFILEIALPPGDLLSGKI